MIYTLLLYYKKINYRIINITTLNYYYFNFDFVNYLLPTIKEDMNISLTDLSSILTKGTKILNLNITHFM